MMSSTFYHIFHLGAIFVLLGYTFYAFAAPAETRKGVLMITGVMSLLVLVSGFGLLHTLQLGFPGWAIVKLVCWLALSAIGGIAYKRRNDSNLLMMIAFAFAITAVALVYLKPF